MVLNFAKRKCFETVNCVSNGGDESKDAQSDVHDIVTTLHEHSPTMDIVTTLHECFPTMDIETNWKCIPKRIRFAKRSRTVVVRHINRQYVVEVLHENH